MECCLVMRYIGGGWIPDYWVSELSVYCVVVMHPPPLLGGPLTF